MEFKYDRKKVIVSSYSIFESEIAEYMNQKVNGMSNEAVTL